MKNKCNVEKEKTHMTVKVCFKSLKSSERKYFIHEIDAISKRKVHSVN